MLGLKKHCKQLEKDLRKEGCAVPKAKKRPGAAGCQNPAEDNIDDMIRTEEIEELNALLTEAKKVKSQKMTESTVHRSTLTLKRQLLELESDNARLTKVAAKLQRELRILSMEVEDLANVKSKLPFGVSQAIDELLPGDWVLEDHAATAIVR